MPSSRLTVDGSGQVYSQVSTLSPCGRESERGVNPSLMCFPWTYKENISLFSVGSSGGIFRVLCASAHTWPDSLGALSTLTLLLQRLYTFEYIMSEKANQCIVLNIM